MYRSPFTICGSRLLDERIKRELRWVVQYLRDHSPPTLSAIWLGGSYGRGEGAAYRLGEEESPWFDYDVYLFYADEFYTPPLRLWSQALSERLGITVQLRSPGTWSQFEAQQDRLIWFELCQAHRVLWAATGSLQTLNCRTQLPLYNAWQLWLEAGARYLQIDQTAPAVELTDKMYRVIAALGDVYLLLQGHGAIGLQARAQLLAADLRQDGPMWRYQLTYFYQEMVQYRLQPSAFMAQSEHLTQRLPKLAHLTEELGRLLLAPQALTESWHHIFLKPSKPWLKAMAQPHGSREIQRLQLKLSAELPLLLMGAAPLAKHRWLGDYWTLPFVG